MNPIYFFWGTIRTFRLKEPSSRHCVGLVPLEPLCLHSVCLETGETRWQGQVDPIKNRVRSKSKLSLN